MRFLRILPAVWAIISCSFSSFTRNVALGSSSTTKPGNSSNSSFDIWAFHCGAGAFCKRRTPSSSGFSSADERYGSNLLSDVSVVRPKPNRFAAARGGTAPDLQIAPDPILFREKEETGFHAVGQGDCADPPTSRSRRNRRTLNGIEAR